MKDEKIGTNVFETFLVQMFVPNCIRGFEKAGEKTIRMNKLQNGGLSRLSKKVKKIRKVKLLRMLFSCFYLSFAFDFLSENNFQME